MNSQYFSKFYRGYVIEQDQNYNWYIKNFPNWVNFGFISAGPWPNFGVACHQVNRLLEHANQAQPDRSTWQQKRDSQTWKPGDPLP